MLTPIKYMLKRCEFPPPKVLPKDRPQFASLLSNCAVAFLICSGMILRVSPKAPRRRTCNQKTLLQNFSHSQSANQ